MEVVAGQEARARWAAARDFAELCELGARFIEGRLQFFPGWLAPLLDAESEPLEGRLARLNRAGFLTLASQPGRPPGPDHAGRTVSQRAFVTGFAAAGTARRLEQLGVASDLYVASFAAHEQGGYRVPVGVCAGEAFCWSGYAAGPEELDLFEEHVDPGAWRALAECRYVCALDPVWGRDDTLWPALSAALEPG